jgi:DNA-directed RNA polymerase II subunit RPB1
MLMMMTAQIKKAQITLLSPDEIRARSVGEVKNVLSNTKGIANPDGIHSALSGPPDRSTRCSTCKHSVLVCGGHPMHMELAQPVYHAGFLPILVKLLRCICHMCSSLILDETDPRLIDGRYLALSDKERLSYLVNLCKTKYACTHCGAPHPDVSPAENLTISRTYSDDVEFLNAEERAYALQPLTPSIVHTVLKHCRDDTLTFMGFKPQSSHPAHMILSVLPVLPLPARPPMAASEGSRVKSHDDLSVRYQGILKVNVALKKAMVENEEADVKRHFVDLQRQVGAFVHHEPRGIAKGGAAGGHMSHRNLQTIYDKMRGKHGHVRENVQGKRTEHAARTVVTGASRMDIDHVGIPAEVALKLTLTVRVNKYNAGELERRVARGPEHLGGARAVTLTDGSRIDLKLYDAKVMGPLSLDVGSVVERPMQNGDLVVINRQPTLHKMSAMCHRVFITNTRTIELPIADTTPYNADFDGDELNIHFPRTPASSELEELMLVTRQIVSPQSNKPIIALVQDSLIGVFLFTNKNEFFGRAEAMQLYMQLSYPCRPFPQPSIFKPVPLWTGKHLFSCILPDNTFLDEVVRDGGSELGKSIDGVFDDEERRVIIRNGHLLCGTLCKRTMGTTANGIIQVVFNDCGHEAAGRLISDAQRLTVEYLQNRGFSIGIGDCVLKPGGKAAVEAVVTRALNRVAHVQALGGANKPAVEECVTKITQSILTHAGAKVQAHIWPDNGLLATVKSGSKGTPVNLAQMMGVVGQQSVEGRRIQPVSTTRRTYPSFPPGDQSPAARGLVTHSYCDGLTATEFTGHAAGGREGLVDTAVKTANTGYAQRKIMAMMMNLGVKYDGTVRNSAGSVVQPIYGGDGYASEKLEKRSLPVLTMSDEALKAWVGGESRACYTKLQLYRDELRAAWLQPGTELSTLVCMPFEPVRVLQRAAVKQSPGSAPCSKQAIEAALDRMCAEIETALKGHRPSLATRCFLRCWLTPRTVKEHGITVQGLYIAEREILHKVHTAIVEPGEMVGPLGGQSIGEPTTQLTLNSFHSAGIGSMNATLGVPRLRALIEASKNTAGMTFMTTRLKQPWSTREDMCEQIAASLEHVILSKVKQASTVEYEPDVYGSKFESDRAMLKYAKAMADPEEDTTTWSTHVIRIVLDRAALMNRFLTPSHVGDAILHALGGSPEMSVIRSESTMLDWTVLVRLKDVSELFEDSPDAALRTDKVQLEMERVLMQEVHDRMMELVAVQGIPLIRRTIVHKERESVVQGDGSVKTQERLSVLSQGSSLANVMELTGVDASKTACNDIHEIAEVLGIDAASRVLFEELRAVLSFGGTFVNPRHLRLLVDLMTHSGELTAVTRHGMIKLGGSTLARACFEETLDVLMKGALYADEDELAGVTEALLIGKAPPVGTGMVKVLSSQAEHLVQAPAIKRIKPWHAPAASIPAAMRVVPLTSDSTAQAMSVDEVLQAKPVERMLNIKPYTARALFKRSAPQPQEEGWVFNPTSPKRKHEEAWNFNPPSPR